MRSVQCTVRTRRQRCRHGRITLRSWGGNAMISVCGDTDGRLLADALQISKCTGNGIEFVLNRWSVTASLWRLLVRRRDIEHVIPDVELKVGSRVNRLGRSGLTIVVEERRSTKFGGTGLSAGDGAATGWSPRGTGTRGGGTQVLPFMFTLAAEGAVREEAAALFLYRFIRRHSRQAHAVHGLGR